MHLPKFRAWKLAETQAQESSRLWSDAHARGQQSSKRLLEAILKRQRVLSHRLFVEAMEEMAVVSDSLDRSGVGPGLAWLGVAHRQLPEPVNRAQAKGGLAEVKRVDPAQPPMP